MTIRSMLILSVLVQLCAVFPSSAAPSGNRNTNECVQLLSHFDGKMSKRLKEELSSQDDGKSLTVFFLTDGVFRSPLNTGASLPQELGFFGLEWVKTHVLPDGDAYVEVRAERRSLLKYFEYLREGHASIGGARFLWAGLRKRAGRPVEGLSRNVMIQLKLGSNQMGLQEATTILKASGVVLDESYPAVDLGVDGKWILRGVASESAMKLASKKLKDVEFFSDGPAQLQLSVPQKVSSALTHADADSDLTLSIVFDAREDYDAFLQVQQSVEGVELALVIDDQVPCLAVIEGKPDALMDLLARMTESKAGAVKVEIPAERRLL